MAAAVEQLRPYAGHTRPAFDPFMALCDGQGLTTSERRRRGRRTGSSVTRRKAEERLQGNHQRRGDSQTCLTEANLSCRAGVEGNSSSISFIAGGIYWVGFWHPALLAGSLHLLGAHFRYGTSSGQLAEPT